MEIQFLSCEEQIFSLKLLIPRAGHLVALVRKAFRTAFSGTVSLPVELDSIQYGYKSFFLSFIHHNLVPSFSTNKSLILPSFLTQNSTCPN